MPHGINAPPAKTIPTRHGFPAALPRRRVAVPSVRCLRIDGRIRLAEILVYPLRNSSIRFLIDWNLASSVGRGPECRRSVVYKRNSHRTPFSKGQDGPPLLFLTAVKDCIPSVPQELKSKGCEGLFPFPLE
ncbi:hypothetical protein B296_00058934 [Ensete ventricosum]|uniref:Uncharacterized protein n=1 Tax=Ensete ventricosum TaxID=4639 RepID=A0A426XAH0_ENSVE|nr:hypothetical protein B296_00058934 [Ensete ventricosum]